MKTIHKADRFRGSHHDLAETKKIKKKLKRVLREEKKPKDASKKIRGNKSNRKTLTVSSTFKSSSQLIHDFIVKDLQEAAQIKPVKSVKDLYEGKDHGKADDQTRAKILARKYFTPKNKFLMSIARQKFPLTKKQCQAVFEAVKKIKSDAMKKSLNDKNEDNNGDLTSDANHL